VTKYGRAPVEIYFSTWIASQPIRAIDYGPALPTDLDAIFDLKLRDGTIRGSETFLRAKRVPVSGTTAMDDDGSIERQMKREPS